MDDVDFHVHDFAWILSGLEEHLPISDAFEDADPQKNGRWWTSQRERMCSWFSAQATLGSGAYSRKEPNLSARTTYNRLQIAEGYIWMAEALGVDVELVQKAADHALELPRKKRPGLVRREYLPWELIAEHAHRSQA